MIGIVLSFMVYIVGMPAISFLAMPAISFLAMPAISFLAIKRLDRTVPENRLKFGILYDGYDSKHYWWWETVIQLRM